MNNWNAYAMQGPQWRGGWGQTEVGPTGGPLGLGGIPNDPGNPPTPLGLGPGPMLQGGTLQQGGYLNHPLLPQQGQANQVQPIPYNGSGINPSGMYTGGNDPSHAYMPPPMSGNDPAHAYSPILYPPMQTGGNDPAMQYGRAMRGQLGMSGGPMNGWGQYMRSRVAIP